MLGLALKTARVDLGLSMFELARLAGVARSTVLRLERGEHSPEPHTALRLSVVLQRQWGYQPPRSTWRADRRARRQPPRVATPRRRVLCDWVPFPDDLVTKAATTLHPEGLEVDQVAEVLGLSPRAVDEAQARALAKLRDLAEEDSQRGAEVRAWLARVAEAREARDERDRESVWASGADDGDE